MRASTPLIPAICGAYGISTSPYFFPSSVRILIRRYLETSALTSSLRWIQSRMTAGAPGAMATLFKASSSGVAFLKSRAKTDEARNAIRAIATSRMRMDVGPLEWMVTRILTDSPDGVVRAEGRNVLVETDVHHAGVEQHLLIITRGGGEAEAELARDGLHRAIVQRHNG